LPAASATPGAPDDPGMPEEAACFAVLGADVEALGAAVARQWGMGDVVATMIRRLPTTSSVRMPDNDDDILRTVASCANEAADALALPAQRVVPAMQRVAQRYARPLLIELRDLQAAFQPSAVQPIAQIISPPLDEAPSRGALRDTAARRSSPGAQR